MVTYYDLRKRETPEPGSGAIVTAALMFCGLCSEVIDTMGGPGYGAVCERCAAELVRGALRGCVVWEEKPE